MASGSGQSTSLPYPVVGELNVDSFPGGSKSLTVYKMTLENVRYAHTVFDNLGALKKDDDPPFFMGMISSEDLPAVDYKQVAEAFKYSNRIVCNANLTNYDYQKEKRKLYGSVKNANKAADDDAFLLVTCQGSCDKHSLSDPYKSRKCSHYLMTDVYEANEVKAIRELGLEHLLDVAGILPILMPETGCISSVGILVSEKDHVLGFRRENNLYCYVNLLLTGKKRWTFIDPDANANFRVCSTHLVGNSNLLSQKLKNCQDPSQHKAFAIMFGKKRNSEARFVIEQLPGHVVFIPSNVYHQVEVLQSSVAIAFNTIDYEWTKQNVEEFYGHCSVHDNICDMKKVARQRAAYKTLQMYAAHVKPEFLSKISLEENNICLKAFTEKMRENAIKQNLVIESIKKSNSQEIAHPSSEFMSSKNVCSNNPSDPKQDAVATSIKNEAETSTPPLYNSLFGVKEAGIVLVEMEAKFKCDNCPMLFTTAQEARYHCKKENLCCKHCKKIIGNEYNKSTHEDKCDQNPVVIEKKEKKEAEMKKKRETEFKKRFNGDEIPPESERAKAMVNCIYCGKSYTYGTNGCGINRHEKYCEKNEEGLIRKRTKKLGRPKGSKKCKIAA